MKYCCCNCHSKFPCKEAVDGYKLGSKNGFLCPFCKANLTELFLSGGKKRLKFDSKAHEKWVSFSGLVGIVTFIAMLVISEGSWITFFVTLGVILSYLLCGYLRWGFTPYPNIIGTKELWKVVLTWRITKKSGHSLRSLGRIHAGRLRHYALRACAPYLKVIRHDEILLLQLP